MKVMYIRCSTQEQNEARQLETAKTNGIEKLFIEKASGGNMENRPVLKECLDFLRENDFLYVADISRIARNTKDLLNIIETLNNKGVHFISLKENIDTTTAAGQFMLTVFGALYELELSNIRTRQAEGIAIAKANGKYKGRKPKQIDEIKFSAMVKEYRNKERTATSIIKEFNITSQTFYRWIKEKGL